MSVCLFLIYLSCIQSSWAVLYCQLFSYLTVPYFSTLYHRGHNFRKKNVVENNIFILIFSTKISETFLTLRRIKLDAIINVNMSSYKALVICVRFFNKIGFLRRFSKNHQILNCNKIRPVGAEYCSVDWKTKRWTDRQTDRQAGRQADMTKLIFAFLGFANATKNSSQHS
jgi:hypothetical protein